MGGMNAPPADSPLIAMASGRAGLSGNQRATSVDHGTPDVAEELAPNTAKAVHSCHGAVACPIATRPSAVPIAPQTRITRVGARRATIRATSKLETPPAIADTAGPEDATVTSNPCSV